MRLITIKLLLFFFITQAQATIYTFHTAGDYNEVSNWDVYPGNDLFTNDTISIEAYCYNISLYASDGYVVFSEGVNQIGIDWLTISDDCQMEIMNSYVNIDIGGSIEFSNNYNYILTPDYSFINIFNYGYGFSSNTCPIWENYVMIEYYNSGTQDAQFLGCMEGYFINDGIIEVNWPSFDLNCDIELASGTINGNLPYTITPYNGAIMQNCSSCVATFNNIETLHLNQNCNIRGQVILNAP